MTIYHATTVPVVPKSENRKMRSLIRKKKKRVVKTFGYVSRFMGLGGVVQWLGTETVIYLCLMEIGTMCGQLSGSV